MKQDEMQSSAGSGSPPPKGFDSMALATVAGVVVMLTISLWYMLNLNRLTERVGRLETRVAGGAAQLGAEQGPDPNRVYVINIAGAPTKGPDNAPVTIVEFSDFQ